MTTISRRNVMKGASAAGVALGAAGLMQFNPLNSTKAFASNVIGYSGNAAPVMGEFGTKTFPLTSPLFGTPKWAWDSYGDWGEQRSVPRDQWVLMGTYDYLQARPSATEIGSVDMMQRFDKAEPDRIYNNAIHDHVSQNLSTQAILEQSFKGSAWCCQYGVAAQGTWIVDITIPARRGIYVVAMLWPKTDDLNPGAEIDFLEGFTGVDEWGSHLHWGTGRNSDGSVRTGDEGVQFPGLNVTGKHRYRLDVAPNNIKIYQDGRLIRNSNTTHSPYNTPMTLVVQTAFDRRYFGVGGSSGINWPIVAGGPFSDPTKATYKSNRDIFDSFSLLEKVTVAPIAMP